MNENILDNLDTDKEVSILSVVKWWESKRFIYFFCLTGIILYMLATSQEAVRNYGIEKAVIESIIVILLANIFYSFGWMVEIWINYYFKNIYFPEGLRLTIFILGLLFSLGLAWTNYISVLS